MTNCFIFLLSMLWKIFWLEWISIFQLPKGQDSVTNRVAGFICKHVFTEHTNCVTGLAVVGRDAGYSTTYLVKGSVLIRQRQRQWQQQQQQQKQRFIVLQRWPK